MNSIKGLVNTLKNRNQLLYSNGIVNLVLAFIMVILLFIDERQILGINPWIKPLKFFISIWLLSWTMGWLLWYLDAKKIVRIYSYLLIITMIIEMAAICLQSYRGTTSHFNISSAINGIIFAIMGIAILTFTIATAVMCFLFFRQKHFNMSEKMIWAVRLGMFFFLLFSMEGGVMISMMAHSIGSVDGGAGIPITNWSKNSGDLRVAHFFGMHSLQIIPLVGYFIAGHKRQVFLFSGLYFIWVFILFIQAMNGKPFIG